MVKVEPNTIPITQLPEVTEPSVGGQKTIFTKRFREYVTTQSSLDLKHFERLPKKPRCDVATAPVTLNKVNLPTKELDVYLW